MNWPSFIDCASCFAFFIPQTSYQVLHIVYHFIVVFFHSYNFFWEKWQIHFSSFLTFIVLCLQVSACFCSWWLLTGWFKCSSFMICSTLYVCHLMFVELRSHQRYFLFVFYTKIGIEGNMFFIILIWPFHHDCHVVGIK